MSKAEEVLTMCSALKDKINVLSPSEIRDMEKRIDDVRGKLEKAKDKVLIKTPSGQRLLSKVEHDILELEEILVKLSKENDPRLYDDLKKSVLDKLVNFEKDVDQVERYWQSFESVMT